MKMYHACVCMYVKEMRKLTTPREHVIVNLLCDRCCHHVLGPWVLVAVAQTLMMMHADCVAWLS